MWPIAGPGVGRVLNHRDSGPHNSPSHSLSLGLLLGPSLATVRDSVCVVLFKDASSKSRGGDDNIPLLAFLFSC